MVTIPNCRSGQSGKNGKQFSGNENTGSDTIYKINLFAENVWVIDENGGVNMYLIVGRDSALLIDTGFGAADLLACVRSITDLPLIIINTHGHPDHSGANYQFREIYAHPLDFDAVRQFSNLEFRKSRDGSWQQDSVVGNADAFESTEEIQTMVLLPVREGYVFDLGERKLEVIEVPGHTPGSICLLDADHKILFTGDNNNTLVWLFLEGCAPLETYLQTLIKLKQREEEFDTMMPGHGTLLDKKFMDEQITCVQKILDGTCVGEPYESFAGEARVCYYERAGVAYNPDNLYIQK